MLKFKELEGSQLARTLAAQSDRNSIVALGFRGQADMPEHSSAQVSLLLQVIVLAAKQANTEFMWSHILCRDPHTPKGT